MYTVPDMEDEFPVPFADYFESEQEPEERKENYDYLSKREVQASEGFSSGGGVCRVS